MHEQSGASGHSGHDNILIFAQVDSVGGESMAYVMASIYEAGAHNVNIVPSLTKKGRPGYLLIIDAPVPAQPRIEDIMVAELGLLGWRLLTGQHISLTTEISERDLVLEVKGKELPLKVPVKRGSTSHGRTIESVDHQFCLDVKRRLWDECGIDLSLRELRAIIWSAVIRGESRVALG